MKIFQDVILASLRNRAEVLKSQDNEVQSVTDVTATVNEVQSSLFNSDRWHGAGPLAL